MDAFWVLVIVATTYLLALLTPGPNMMLIAQHALTGRVRSALLTALGVASGSTLWALGAMAGVAVLLNRYEIIDLAIRIGGAGYLIWFALKLWRGATGIQPAADCTQSAGGSGARDFLSGVLTSLSNPKSAVFWTSVFGAAFPHDAPLWFEGLTLVTVAGLAFGFYAGMAGILGRASARKLTPRRHLLIRRAAAVLLAAVGTTLGVNTWRFAMKP